MLESTIRSTDTLIYSHSFLYGQIFSITLASTQFGNTYNKFKGYALGQYHFTNDHSGFIDLYVVVLMGSAFIGAIIGGSLVF